MNLETHIEDLFQQAESARSVDAVEKIAVKLEAIASSLRSARVSLTGMDAETLSIASAQLEHLEATAAIFAKDARAHAQKIQDRYDEEYGPVDTWADRELRIYHQSVL